MAVILQGSSTKPDKTALGGLCFELQFKAIEFPWLHLVQSPSEIQVKCCCQEVSPGLKRTDCTRRQAHKYPEGQGSIWTTASWIIFSDAWDEVDIFQ